MHLSPRAADSPSQPAHQVHVHLPAVWKLSYRWMVTVRRVALQVLVGCKSCVCGAYNEKETIRKPLYNYINSLSVASIACMRLYAYICGQASSAIGNRRCTCGFMLWPDICHGVRERSHLTLQLCSTAEKASICQVGSSFSCDSTCACLVRAAQQHFVHRTEHGP